MRVFATKVFAKFAKSTGLTDEVLLTAAKEVKDQLVDAELGGNLYKKRVALPGGGKRGGARTILVYCKSTENIFFLYGFSKNAKPNLTAAELIVYRELEKEYSSYTEKQIKTLLDKNELREIKDATTSKEDSK